MAEDLSSLGEEDLSRLVQVIETLEHSAFDFLELEVGGMKVALGKGDPAAYTSPLRSGSSEYVATAAAPAPAVTPALDRTAPVAPDTVAGRPGGRAEPASVSVEQPPPVETSDAPSDGTVEIRSPMVGMFYTHPKPGEPAYVSVGSAVQPDTTVALLEVMKMFNAVSAGVEGTVVAILAEDNHLVEYDQPLFRVRPT